ncbi:MAG: hypothetical protein ACREGI_00930, partial [Candidatus Levyibacteriota bacterium]
ENTTHGVDYFHTFDFDHIAFDIRGVSSIDPVPAGGYKLPGQENQKDVNITFAKQVKEPDGKIQIGFSMQDTFSTGFPISGIVTIRNVGESEFFDQTLAITSPLSPQQKFLQTKDIPPLGYVAIPFTFQKMAVLTNTRVPITIHVAGQSLTKIITIQPFLYYWILIGGGITLGLFCIIVSIITIRTWRLPFSQPRR